MNEQNRMRLQRITTRHANGVAQNRSEAEGDAAFLAGFARVRSDVLRPVMEDVGAQLRAAGYDFRIGLGDDARSPSIDLHLLIPGRGDSKDTIRFFAQKYPERGWQVIGEIELRRSPIEITRFEAVEQITPEVAEQLIVDAVEQVFASTDGR